VIKGWRINGSLGSSNVTEAVQIDEAIKGPESGGFP